MAAIPPIIALLKRQERRQETRRQTTRAGERHQAGAGSKM